MSLDPLTFNTKSDKEITTTLQIFTEIKEIILVETGIVVSIKNFKPPVITFTVDSSPAASNLNLHKSLIIQKLKKYNITKIRIITH
ncbi:hypothetical protein H0W80_03975 [Candidatus Saccharibacteria bacterium]|nr:hypothetical protein [Candidatus Saccharibacteria bacterium]